VSCSASGARPAGVRVGVEGNGGRSTEPLADVGDVWEQSAWLAGSVPGWTPYEHEVTAYQPRFVSDTGRVFFDSPVGLVPLDVNGLGDVYEWEPAGVGSCAAGSSSGSSVYEPARAFEGEGRKGESVAGCVGLISSGSSGEESAFLDASESGDDVFFLTSSRLVPSDVEGGQEVYDAHRCTTAAPCPVEAAAPPECVTVEGCRGASAQQPPIFGAPPSATFNGVGNITPSVLPPPGPPKKKVAKKATKCPRGKTRNKHGKCVKTRKKATKSAEKASYDRRATR